MTTLTNAQQRALTILGQFNAKHGYMPSTRQLAQALGMTPTGAINHLKALEKKGRIVRYKGIGRGITIL